MTSLFVQTRRKILYLGTALVVFFVPLAFGKSALHSEEAHAGFNALNIAHAEVPGDPGGGSACGCCGAGGGGGGGGDGGSGGAGGGGDGGACCGCDGCGAGCASGCCC